MNIPGTVSPPDIKPNLSSLLPPVSNALQHMPGASEATFPVDVKPNINACNIAQPPPNLPTLNAMHLQFGSSSMQSSASFQNLPPNFERSIQQHNMLPSFPPGPSFSNLNCFPPPPYVSSTVVSGVQPFSSMPNPPLPYPMPTPELPYPVPNRPSHHSFAMLAPPPQSFPPALLNTPPPKLERADVQPTNQVPELPYFDPSQPPPCIPATNKLLAEPQAGPSRISSSHSITFPPPNFLVPPPLVVPPPNIAQVSNCAAASSSSTRESKVSSCFDRGRRKSRSLSPIQDSKRARQELCDSKGSTRQDPDRVKYTTSQKRGRSKSPEKPFSSSRSLEKTSSSHSRRRRYSSRSSSSSSRGSSDQSQRSRSRDKSHRSERNHSRYKSHRSKRSRSRGNSHRSDRSSSSRSSRSQWSSSRASSSRSRRSRSRSSSRYSKSIQNPRRSRSRDRHEKRERRNYRGRLEDQLKKQKNPYQKEPSFVEKWRMNNCNSQSEMEERLDALTAMDAEEILAEEKKIWTRSACTSLYYIRRRGTDVFERTDRVKTLCDKLTNIIEEFESIKKQKPPFDYSKNRKKCTHNHSYSDSDSCSSSDDEEENWMAELELKQKHPDRLHPELWFNDFGEMNDGPLCRCSKKSRRSGIRHNIYAGEETLPLCENNSNNSDRLYHYRITVSPPTNFLMTKPTLISYDDHEYIFEGFSLFSHFPLEKLPPCKVIRFNIQYTILYIEETVPDGFSIEELDLFSKYLFTELLELVDLDLKSSNDQIGCPQFHIMPRFVREVEHNGKELLPMCKVIAYLVDSYSPVVSDNLLANKDDMMTYEWQDFADEVKGMLVTKPGSKPSTFRVDQLDRASEDKDDVYPAIVHFGIRPPQLSYAGSPEYQKAWKSYVKLRHLLANKAKRSDLDKSKLASKELSLQQMRTNSKMKRGVTVAVSSRGFYRTGIMCDIVQHAMLIPVLVCHLRFHRSLEILEKRIKYKFKNKYLIQLALTHPSYREHFGTNPDHARNSLTNCGIRQPEYGDRKIHFQNTRKRGINTLINIMSRLGKKSVTESHITHNERLEFLGDAVVEFVTSIHLFHMFPDIEEGGLATYRAAIVQNQHLAVLAKKIGLDDFMLYAHGSDLCHELELKHAMANCYEALMGAIFLDGGIEAADKVFSRVMWEDNKEQYEVWVDFPKHPLQEQHPDNDRHWIERSSILRILTEFETSIGVVFRHIRLLARAFTTRSVGYTYLTLGSNQRLEFLGDTVLQLITSEHLYNHFPEHHEGHLSLLRSSLVNNKTQSVVCDDLGIPYYANLINPKVDFKMKDRADLLEALMGAIYIDRGMRACEMFCKVCFFPRLQYFILNQEWNDPKSKLQQCCLTLRTLDGGEPDIPIYKVIECKGPTNSRVYTVAVYFQNERLATATGSSIQIAEMNAAKEALTKCPNLFPQLDHQKRVISKSIELQRENMDVVDTGLEV